MGLPESIFFLTGSNVFLQHCIFGGQTGVSFGNPFFVGAFSSESGFISFQFFFAFIERGFRLFQAGLIIIQFIFTSVKRSLLFGCLSFKRSSLFCSLSVKRGSLFCSLSVKRGSLSCGLSVKRGSLSCGLSVKRSSLFCGLSVKCSSLRDLFFKSVFQRCFAFFKGSVPRGVLGIKSFFTAVEGGFAVIEAFLFGIKLIGTAGQTFFLIAEGFFFPGQRCAFFSDGLFLFFFQTDAFFFEEGIVDGSDAFKFLVDDPEDLAIGRFISGASESREIG